MPGTVTQQPLPMLPMSVVNLLRVPKDDPAYFERVSEVVVRDAALTTMALQLACSSAYGGHVPPTSVEQAVMRIGARRFVSLAFSANLVLVFAPTSDEMVGLWRHATHTSVTARSLAACWTRLGVQPDWAGVACLVHNLGAMILAMRQPDLYVRVLESHRLDDPSIISAERKAFGQDHQEVGKEAAEEMKLPPDLIELISQHHAQSRAFRPLLTLLKVATTFTSWSRANANKTPNEPEARKDLRALLASTGLERPSDAVLDALASEISRDVTAELERLGIQ